MSVKNKSREKHHPEVAIVTGEAFDELGSLDWIGIPEFPYVMKYKFDEDGYMLMVSDLTAVYGEKLDEKAIQERFQVLNPYAEMLPKVILKHVKQSVKNILAGEKAGEETKLISRDSNLVTIQHQFNASGVRFIFNFEPQVLSGNQFRAHILRPALLRSFIACEEKEALQSKVEELEGRPSSSSSSESSERRKMKAMYSAIKEFNSPGSGVIDAFLYLQKGKIILPKSLESTPFFSPTKRVNSSSISSSQRHWLKSSKNSIDLPYEDDDSDVSLESQQSEEPEISTKTEKIDDDDADMKLFHVLVNNLSAKSKSMKESNKRVSPKREMEEEDSNEDSASEPTSSLEPSPAKKKKLFKF